MKKLREIAMFIWNWYVVRTWVYFFPPKNDSAKPGDGEELQA